MIIYSTGDSTVKLYPKLEKQLFRTSSQEQIISSFL